MTTTLQCRTYPRLTTAALLLATFNALVAPWPVQARERPAEEFQHPLCDVVSIFARLSGSAANGTQHVSPTDDIYRVFALDIATRNGFKDPRAIGGAMNGRAAFVYYYDSARTGAYTFAMFVADHQNWFGIAYGGRFCHLIDDELTLPVRARPLSR